MTTHHYRTIVDGVPISYREAGNRDNPTVLLLHGFPASSFMYRNLLPTLAGRWYVIAPDLPGFGFSGAPGTNTFDRHSTLIGSFTEQLGLARFTVMIFD